MDSHSTSNVLPRRFVQQAIAALQETGAYFHERGWSLGTSSNYSISLTREPYMLLITASGKDKGRLGDNDFVLLGPDGRLLSNNGERPSAETGLHLLLTREPGIGSVLHTHSVWGTLLSDVFGDEGGFWIAGYEMLKGLAGVTTHEHREWVPIFPNSQDIPSLAEKVAARRSDAQQPAMHGFLIRGHGLYTWGRDISEARRHVEIFEFLFELVGRRMTLNDRT